MSSENPLAKFVEMAFEMYTSFQEDAKSLKAEIKNKREELQKLLQDSSFSITDDIRLLMEEIFILKSQKLEYKKLLYHLNRLIDHIHDPDVSNKQYAMESFEIIIWLLRKIKKVKHLIRFKEALISMFGEQYLENILLFNTFNLQQLEKELEPKYGDQAIKRYIDKIKKKYLKINQPINMTAPPKAVHRLDSFPKEIHSEPRKKVKLDENIDLTESIIKHFGVQNTINNQKVLLSFSDEENSKKRQSNPSNPIPIPITLESIQIETFSAQTLPPPQEYNFQSPPPHREIFQPSNTFQNKPANFPVQNPPSNSYQPPFNSLYNSSHQPSSHQFPSTEKKPKLNDLTENSIPMRKMDDYNRTSNKLDPPPVVPRFQDDLDLFEQIFQFKLLIILFIAWNAGMMLTYIIPEINIKGIIFQILNITALSYVFSTSENRNGITRKKSLVILQYLVYFGLAQFFWNMFQMIEWKYVLIDFVINCLARVGLWQKYNEITTAILTQKFK